MTVGAVGIWHSPLRRGLLDVRAEGFGLALVAHDAVKTGVFGALVEFERHLIRKRTMAGLASARARGRKGGRPRAMDEDHIDSGLMKRPEAREPDNVTLYQSYSTRRDLFNVGDQVVR